MVSRNIRLFIARFADIQPSVKIDKLLVTNVSRPSLYAKKSWW